MELSEREVSRSLGVNASGFPRFLSRQRSNNPPGKVPISPVQSQEKQHINVASFFFPIYCLDLLINFIGCVHWQPQRRLRWTFRHHQCCWPVRNSSSPRVLMHDPLGPSATLTRLGGALIAWYVPLYTLNQPLLLIYYNIRSHHRTSYHLLVIYNFKCSYSV